MFLRLLGEMGGGIEDVDVVGVDVVENRRFSSMGGGIEDVDVIGVDVVEFRRFSNMMFLEFLDTLVVVDGVAIVVVVVDVVVVGNTT